MINGFVYANVYQSEFIVKIDPANGHVTGKIDLPGLQQQYFANQITARTDVLNGIALTYDGIQQSPPFNTTTTTGIQSDQVWVTGKYWPNMYRIQLIDP